MTALANPTQRQRKESFMIRFLTTAILSFVAVCGFVLVTAPNRAAVSQLVMIGGNDPQGIGGNCTGTVVRNCNYPSDDGECPHDASYCVLTSPSNKECRQILTLHPCMNFEGCAVRKEVDCFAP